MNTNVIIKSFINPLADITLNLFNSFLFEVIVFSFSSKLIFFTKLAISFLLAQLACFSFAVKFSDVNLLNS